MKPSLTNNWPVKLASLVAAFAIWFLIKQHIGGGDTSRFAGLEAANLKSLSKNQSELAELLEKAAVLQNRINDDLIRSAPKAVPVEEPQPSEAPPPEKEEKKTKPSNKTKSSSPEQATPPP